MMGNCFGRCRVLDLIDAFEMERFKTGGRLKAILLD
jgi:hypothetical protein